MVTRHEVQRQLRAIGADFRLWGRAEIRELEHILVPGETTIYCINGRYDGGFAMLCLTDQRVLLVDKKPLYLTLEDIRFDMISEVDFSQRLMDATVRIHTPSKNLRFTAFKTQLLRKATAYLQSRIMVFRQQHTMPVAQQFIQTPVNVPASNPVVALEHRITNPYTKVPFMMRRRVTRFHT